MKSLATLQAFIGRHTAYRLNFLLLVLGPALIFFGVKLSLWTSVYAGSENAVLGGYTRSEMLEYQLWTFILALFAQSYNATSLATEIRLGKISTWLLVPYPFIAAQIIGFLSFLSLQAMACSVLLVACILWGFMAPPSMTQLLQGVSLMLLSSFLWFFIQLGTAFMAFWLEETWVLRVLSQICIQFLSGAILPLSFFPDPWVSVLQWTPFPLMTQMPIEVFNGKLSVPIWTLQCLGLFWVAVLAAGSIWIYRRGLKMYTAAGI